MNTQKNIWILIDTIQLRFHGILAKKTDTLSIIENENANKTMFVVPEHHELYKRMLKYKGRFFNMVKVLNKSTITTTIMDESDFLHLQNANKKSALNHIKQVMQFIDEKEVNEMTMKVNGKFHTPSSISSVVFNINENGGFIDFNLSIPKYLYDHSLAEFVPQVQSNRYFNTQNVMAVSVQRRLLHERLLKFLDRFYQDLCDMFQLDKELYYPNPLYIELRRIDLCWNQHFQTKEQALNYLENQKKIANIKSSKSNNILKEFESSLTYFTSSGAYFKIYHKGTEYISSKFGDLKKHQDFNKRFLDDYANKILNINHTDTTLNEHQFNTIKERLKNKDYVLNLFENKLKGNPVNISEEEIRKKANETAKLIKKIQPFKIQFLKDEMDKILRYEISLRGDFFNYHYKTKVFRKDCPIFSELKDNYKYVHSVTNSKDLKKPKLSRYELYNYKMIDRFFKRTISLVLSQNQTLKRWVSTSSMEVNQTNKYNIDNRFFKYTLLSEKDVGVFSDDFLQICLDYFIKTLKTFKVDKIDNQETLLQKIHNHNSKAKKIQQDYDNTYSFLCKDIKGNYILRGKKIISKASQLLTQKEKHAKGMKTVHPLRIVQIFQAIQDGKSLPLIRKELQLSSSVFSNLRKDLELFDIKENTVNIEMPIEFEFSFREYYHKTSGLNYQNNMFRNQKQLRYG